jgi:hypothetical protein
MPCLAAFDLGIKNLSYCVVETDTSGALCTVRRWANLNLLAGGADSQAQTRCGEHVSSRLCGGPASYQDVSNHRLLCKKCAKKSAKPVLAADGTTVKALRAYAIESCGLAAASVNKMAKPALLEALGAIRLLPYKAPKAKGVSLQDILVGMETCLTTELDHLAAADRILVENQPSEFAPHMKSVQIMLFTLLDHRLRTERGWTGRIDFVHAKTKTAGTTAGTGKENKRARKLAGIQRVRDALAGCPAAAAQLAWWESQAKQDDLADALLMCLDAASVQTVV